MGAWVFVGDNANSLQALMKRILSARWRPLTSKITPLSCRFGRRKEFVAPNLHNHFRGFEPVSRVLAFAFGCAIHRIHTLSGQLPALLAISSILVFQRPKAGSSL
jgi:hypothetical protein